jgi:hypothetical protein
VYSFDKTGKAGRQAVVTHVRESGTEALRFNLVVHTRAGQHELEAGYFERLGVPWDRYVS